jgi:hypothetical protein
VNIREHTVALKARNPQLKAEMIDAKHDPNVLEVVEEEDMLPQPLVEDHLPLAEIQPEESVPVGVQSLIRVQRSKRPYVKDNMDTVWTRWQK